MEIGSFEDRIAIETKSKIVELLYKMKRQFRVEEIKTEVKFFKGFKKGLESSLKDVELWLEIPNIKEDEKNV